MTKYKWINRWIVCNLENLHFFVALFCVVLYAAGMVAGSDILKRSGYIGSLVLILLFFLHKNLHAHYEFLVLHKEMDHLPAAQMKQVNAFFMSLFLGIMTVLLLIAPLFPVESLLLSVVRGFVFVLRRIFSLFHFKEKKETEILFDDSMERGGMPDLGTVETSWITELLDFLVEVIGYAVIAVLIWYGLKAFYQGLCRLFRPRVFDDDEKVFLTPTVKVKRLFGEKGKKRERQLWSDFSYSGRMRKAYIKTIQGKNAEKKEIPLSASPKEIETLVGMEERVLHTLYEKARYSREGCSKEDWKIFEANRTLPKGRS